MARLPTLLLACLLALVLGSSALLLPANSKPSNDDLFRAACDGVPSGATVCHPYDQTKFIQCDNTTGHDSKGCPGGGYLYDYGLRTCLPPNRATPCPLPSSWRCPAPNHFTIGKNGVSLPMGPGFGEVGSHTINMTNPGTIRIFCPVIAHCQSGQYLEITVLKRPAFSGYVARETEVDFHEVLTNTMLYPPRLRDVVGYAGDSVKIWWDEPIHMLTSFDNTAEDAAMTVPYPPQPIYKCPNWLNISDAPGGVHVEPLVGEVRLADVMIGDSTFNLTAHSSMDGGALVCPLPPHCRLGQIFGLTVLPKVNGSKPEVHMVHWMLETYQNFPDLTVHEEDIISFWMGPLVMGPQGPDVTTLPIHGLSFLPKDSGLVEHYFKY